MEERRQYQHYVAHTGRLPLSLPYGKRQALVVDITTAFAAFHRLYLDDAGEVHMSSTITAMDFWNQELHDQQREMLVQGTCALLDEVKAESSDVPQVIVGGAIHLIQPTRGHYNTNYWVEVTQFFNGVQAACQDTGRNCQVNAYLVPSYQLAHCQNKAVRFVLGRSSLDLHTAPPSFLERIFKSSSEYCKGDTATKAPLLQAQKDLFRGLVTSDSNWMHVIETANEYRGLESDRDQGFSHYLVAAGLEDELESVVPENFREKEDMGAGYFVLAGTLYDMAKKLGLSNRILTHKDLLAAARQESDAQPLTSMLKAFGPGSSFVIKRTWRTLDDSFQVSWSLGWFLSCMERMAQDAMNSKCSTAP